MVQDQPVRVTRLEVLRGHAVCTVAFSPGVPRNTSPALLNRVLPAFPALPHHACVNGAGKTFGDVMANTPLPHLFEHMVVDLQVRQAAQRSQSRGAAGERAIVGTSEWLDEAAGIARIDVSFADDMVALRAIRDALAALNAALRENAARAPFADQPT